MADVLCVGAHPDDVEIGMGGTVARLTRGGAEVLIVDLTDGEPTPFGSREIREAEAGTAATVLGASRITLGQPNRYLLDTIEARTELAEVIRAERPEVLFVPYPEDAHPDHVAAAAIAEAARFYAKFTKTEMTGEPHYPRRIYRYMAVHRRMVREPSFIVDVSDTVATKAEALRSYRSQFELNPGNDGLIEAVLSQAQAWGAMIRVSAGEPFFALEPPGVSDVLSLI
jgi:bacillithiol biosynthesis deacetylase BshB1